MNQNIILIVSFAVGIIAALPCYKIAHKFAGGGQRFIDSAKAAGHIVTGHCIKAKKSWTHGRPDSLTEMDNFSDKVTYEYVIDGKYFYKSIYVPRKGVKAHSNYQQEIEIFYDPKNPRKAKCQDEVSPKDQNAAGFITLIVVFCVVAYAVYAALEYIF